MDVTLTNWPTVDRLIWTIATVGIMYALGVIINAIVIRRLQRLASLTSGEWDDAVVLELRQRIPLWSLLAGLGLSIGYWPLQRESADIASNLIGAVAVLSVTLAMAAVAVRLLGAVAPRVSPEVRVSGLMRNVVRIVIVTVGLLVVLRTVGVEITPMLAALGVGGLAVALALQEPLSNLFAGLFITLAGQVRIGDYVRLENGPEGHVTDFRWHATQLRTLPGNLVIVPNATLAQAIVTNFDRPTQDLGLAVEITVGAGADLAVVERVAIAVAQDVMRQVPGGMPDADVSVRFQGFSDLGIRCAVGVRGKRFEDQFLLRHELIKRLQPALRDADVEVATLKRAEGPRRRELRGQRSEVRGREGSSN